MTYLKARHAGELPAEECGVPGKSTRPRIAGQAVERPDQIIKPGHQSRCCASGFICGTLNPADDFLDLADPRHVVAKPGIRKGKTTEQTDLNLGKRALPRFKR